VEESFGIIPLKKEKDKYFVFLVKLKSGNHFGFPKGHKNANETSLETAKRELFEETNLEISELISDQFLTEKYFLTKNGKKIEKKVIYFISFVKGKEKLDNNEILEGFWVPIEDAKKIITYESSKKIVDEIFKIMETL